MLTAAVSNEDGQGVGEKLKAKLATTGLEEFGYLSSLTGGWWVAIWKVERSFVCAVIGATWAVGLLGNVWVEGTFCSIGRSLAGACSSLSSKPKSNSGSLKALEIGAEG